MGQWFTHQYRDDPKQTDDTAWSCQRIRWFKESTNSNLKNIIITCRATWRRKPAGVSHPVSGSFGIFAKNNWTKSQDLAMQSLHRPNQDVQRKSKFMSALHRATSCRGSSERKHLLSSEFAYFFFSHYRWESQRNSTLGEGRWRKSGNEAGKIN